MKFKIAVVQFDIKQFSPEENLKKAEKFIKKAIFSQAQIKENLPIPKINIETIFNILLKIQN
jgi:hypothetical protein